MSNQVLYREVADGKVKLGDASVKSRNAMFKPREIEILFETSASEKLIKRDGVYICQSFAPSGDLRSEKTIKA